MGIFSGLEKYGFKSEDRKVYEKPDSIKESADGNKEPEVEEKPAFKEEDVLFLKSHTCPICDKPFKCLSVRAGKIRSVGQDNDLRPIYRDMDPLKYDAVVCPNCGYAALNRYFDVVMPVQAKRIRAEIQPNFAGIRPSMSLYSYEEAVERYKLVLLCDVVGGASNSRKAYTCLKMAWILRGQRESNEAELSEEEASEIMTEELECIQNAYDGYMLAFSSETFPMSGMDEITLTYLTAELAYELEKYRESLQLISRILVNKSVSARIKDKALDLKERIREKVKDENH